MGQKNSCGRNLRGSCSRHSSGRTCTCRRQPVRRRSECGCAECSGGLENSAKAEWESGTIADGNLVIADQSGNDNDLRMQLYTGKQPTEDTAAADWTQYLSFSDDSMTGDAVWVFNGDSSDAGADFITVDDAAINSETFENGYTMEFIYYFPTDWTTADSWMSLIARLGRADSVSEWQQGTMFNFCVKLQGDTVYYGK